MALSAFSLHASPRKLDAAQSQEGSPYVQEREGHPYEQFREAKGRCRVLTGCRGASAAWVADREMWDVNNGAGIAGPLKALEIPDLLDSISVEADRMQVPRRHGEV